MGLTQALGPGPTALDTPAFIYFIQEHPEFLPLIRPIFEEAERGAREIITSALTLLEVLVVPYRAGDLPLAERYEILLTRSRNVRLVELSRSRLRTAAQLRGLHRVRTPDSLQLATALSCRCTDFVTNDRRLPSIPGLTIHQLRNFLGA